MIGDSRVHTSVSRRIQSAPDLRPRAPECSPSFTGPRVLRRFSGPRRVQLLGFYSSVLTGLKYTASRNQEDYEDLAQELATLSDSLTEHLKTQTPTTKCISSFNIGIEQQAREIKAKMSRGPAGRFLVAKADEEDMIRRYRRIQSLFRQLQANLSVSAWSITNEHLVNTRLEGLQPVKLATYDSTLSSTVNRRKCTEGTRTQVLLNLDDWVDGIDVPTVYWMNGMAGTGKTTIACTFSERLEHRELLAASFFCTRTSADCRDVTRIIPTIAYQLARYSIPFQSALYEILGKEPDAGSKNAEKQFERLLRDPLQKAREAIPDNLVVVIDALDECDDHSGVQGMLNMLFRYAPDIPLKFLVTSRPEPDIYKRMAAHAQSHAVVRLHDIESSLVRADIALYLEEEVATMSLSSAHIAKLVEQSGSLFIYAATLVRYIQSGSDPERRLRSVLAMTPEATRRHAQIDALYTAVLRSALNEDEMEKDEMDDIRTVLRTILFAQEPINIETVAVLAGVNDTRRVQSALLPLRSVLHQSEETGLVSTLHASFPDFMFSNERSGDYFCDIVEHSHILAERCFLAMKGHLRFNICKLESSFVPDENVNGLQDRIKQRISPTLAYACRYWGNHLALASKSDVLLRMTEEFICDRLLFWMEVLSLKREMAGGIGTLLKAKEWLDKVRSGSPERAGLIEDARDFVTGFASSSASNSTPHIYVSSLPFCPRSSSVYKNYWKHTRGLLELKGSLMERRAGAALAIWNIGSGVWSVAYSPDGTRVAVGCGDCTVRILNAHDGIPVVHPLQGHTYRVRSIGFSPDGKLIASGSWDCSIRVWNAHNGTLVSGPFADNGDMIYSVTFSPDSTRILSGSDDSRIRIWDANNGTLLRGPFEGHTSYVRSVAFSPDGTLIASGSSDRTIRLRHSHDGSLATPPLEGHTDFVMSIAFTPDGTRLVSGSGDMTIRVWNILDGSPVGNPFEGHTGEVHSVAVSPDGTRVASGSEDRTVRVWNIDDGTLVVGPFVGHTDTIYSVAYSPDGAQVVSGADDRTIRVWNVREGLLPPPFPFQEHMMELRSCMLSGNGTRLLSSSTRNDVWVWDITSEGIVPSPLEGSFAGFIFPYSSSSSRHFAACMGNHSFQVINTRNLADIIGPLKGHTNSITSLVFSPDNTLLVTGSDDCTVRVWDLRKVEPLSSPFRGHVHAVTSVALFPDHSRVISLSTKDKTIRVWSICHTITRLCSPINTIPSPRSDHSRLHAPQDWMIRQDGWVINGRSELLFWIPSDLRQNHAWPSPHAEFIICKDGVLHIPKQEVAIGEQWSRCYITK